VSFRDNATQKQLKAMGKAMDRYNEQLKTTGSHDLPEPVKIVIEVKGGVVQDVYTEAPVTYLVIDRDVEGSASEKIYKDKDGQYLVYAHDTDQRKGFINRMFKKHVG